MRFALGCNLAGTVLVFLAFQATSSNFRLITTSDGRSALCVNNRALIIAIPNDGFTIGTSSCPEWVNARPAAVVNFENRTFVWLGGILTFLGFAIQFLAIPSPKTI